MHGVVVDEALAVVVSVSLGLGRVAQQEVVLVVLATSRPDQRCLKALQAVAESGLPEVLVTHCYTLVIPNPYQVHSSGQYSGPLPAPRGARGPTRPMYGTVNSLCFCIWLVRS